MSTCTNAERFGSGAARFLPPSDEAQGEDQYAALTEDQHLANLDSYSDWLAGECMHVIAACSDDIQFQVRRPGDLFDEGVYQIALDGATAAQLQHVTLTTSCQRRAWLALCELKKRYLLAQGLTA